MNPILEIDDYSYGYPEQDTFLLRDICMTIKPGECHCITGPTGIGKSTLLVAIQGLLPDGNEQGVIKFCGNGNKQFSGLVLQNPNTQILARSIGAEVAFGLENMLVSPDEMKPIVVSALKETGLDCPIDRDTKKLSMGQKYRLILSALTVLQPRLLMIDEPSGQLDLEGLIDLKKILKRFKSSGMGLLISEHRPNPFLDVVDVFWKFDNRGNLNRVENIEETPLRDWRQEISRKNDDAIVTVQKLKMNDQDFHVWDDVNFKVYPGEMVAVCGKNGSGKTTLMRCLMGTIKPDSGEVSVFGENPTPEKLRGRVGCLFQDPSRQFYEDSVFEEVAFQLQRSGHTQWKEKVNIVLEECGVSDLSELSPHKLSYGQQHLVAMSMVIVNEPSLLLLDDPFTGLDSDVLKTIYYVLDRLRKQKNTSIIVTTHHPEDGLFFDRRLLIQGGRIIEK